ncbi:MULTISPECIES: glutamine amidotransferase [unclassified Paraburkholderia]|uniref:glutamine amidotransferase n=1 Tax=unclassified Paraburkholderia TaxID=2615204 RepID=UPI002AB15C7E|nr:MULTISPECIES: glutamine amidotransferase [unclassified Paraburkholderia]
MTPTPILILQVGTPPDEVRSNVGDLSDWFCLALGKQSIEVEIVRVFEGEHLPPPDANRVAIITGSWAHVTERLKWSEDTAQWIREAMKINMPLFGVCYGHQLIAHALGGVVDFHPDGREVGCHAINLLPAAESDPLLIDLPTQFAAHLTHLQTIVKLPQGAEVLAYSAHDRHQIVRYGPNAVSTQFHPEFTPTIAEKCIRLRADVLASEGRSADALVDDLVDAKDARHLLNRFVELALQTRGAEVMYRDASGV